MKRRITDILAIGFGATTLMWTVGYFCHLPAMRVASPVVFFLLLLAQGLGGFVAGRWTPRGLKGGALVGLLSAVLNLLILGSVLRDLEQGQGVPAALIWIPGSLLAGVVVGLLGAAVGRVIRRGADTEPDWLHVFSIVTAAATLVLLTAGGIVTGYGAGLAVVDWPNSLGENMFLFPLSKMTGGIYYEHAHRLLGSLVGLTTLILALRIQTLPERRWLQTLAWAAVIAVIVQGILGGLRVTGRFTLSQEEAEVAPNIWLAVVHGVLGQLFLGLLVAMAAFTSRLWRSGIPPKPWAAARTDRGLGSVLLILIISQLVFGALQRHVDQGLMIHVAFAVIVIGFAVLVGVRAWGPHPDVPALNRAGLALASLSAAQLVLGMFALVAIGMFPNRNEAHAVQVIITTMHQVCGALLLSAAVVVRTLGWRLLAAPETRGAMEASGAPN